MPSLGPIVEATETLGAVAEAAETLASIAEATETLAALSELTNTITPAIPGLYPSAATFPSAAGTYPSLGTPEIPGQGLLNSGLSEDTLDLIVLAEA